ncbi:undecaprenyl-phosphate glucose phosphotransferase [Serratia fonticola]|uniref:Undecaprenyl-phosphate glucose phosphotransferase n=1 Tax=Serratia fonticola TaxID=47917 RepID=A0ABY9PTY9_SERFO|nr:undecaprenyl-phosphate glucose phosphotransferase [Serratia fonticola]WMT16487.1 undecaprenyl-phosphate glucose phosphotransferase [Serratia fonticola]
MNSLHQGFLKTNASLISIVQRFSDICIIFIGLFIICAIEGVSFIYIHWLLVMGVLIIFQMIGGMTDFYRSWRGVKFSTELKLLVRNWTLSMLIAAGIASFWEDVDLDVRAYLSWYFLVCVGFTIFRLLIRYITGGIRKLGYNVRRIVIAGSLPSGVDLAKSFSDAPWMGFEVMGIYSDDPLDYHSNVEISGDIKDVILMAKKGCIDRIYIAMPMSNEHKIKKLVKELTDTTCSVMLIPDIFTFNLLQSRHEEINGISVVSLFDTPMSGVNRVLKRIEDIFLSLFILIFISPVLLSIACVVKFTSDGPIIFRQVRYGMDGKPIKVLKFRTMKVMENGDNVRQATRDDKRVTAVGRFLRRTSLDELPQFFNVLVGDMSVVGPRPHAVAHNEQYRTLIKGYMLRHKMKPGITGWAQINGWRGETDTLDKMEKRVEFDLAYIRNWSLWLDVKIVFLTIFKGFVGKSTY